MNLIGLNPFFLERLKIDQRYYPVDFSTDKLLEQLQERFLDPRYTSKGYRHGVYKVVLDPEGWRSRVIALTPNAKIQTLYRSRVSGEPPRRESRALVASLHDLPPAELVEAVLYQKQVLAERDESQSGATWDVITILAHPTKESAPMTVGTLMANHFGVQGGTNTLMTATEFEEALKASYLYWKDRILASIPCKECGDTREITDTEGLHWTCPFC